MNRIIKIRAWDEERKVMEPSVGFTDSDCGRIWQREACMIDDNSHFTGRHWIPMQSTGLLDKNGKEIYEGDVLECGGYKKEVIFWEGCFCYKTTDGKGHIFSPKEVEVIGNIYENPELLK